MNPGKNKTSLRNLKRGRTSASLQGRKHPDASSAYLGVSRHPHGWRARLSGEHLGYFDSQEEAAAAYDAAAHRRFGADAKTNF